MEQPLVSVVVRSHNDAAFAEATLSRLEAQILDARIELLSIDDHSTDGTADIIAAHPSFRRIPPPAGPYHPGLTLNTAIRAAAGELIVFNNADAVPQSLDYLARLVAPLREDSALTAVYANQLPRPDATALVRKDSLRAFGDGSIAAKWRFFFSLAASAIRRDALIERPFDEQIQYSEDVHWAYNAVQNGARLKYVPDAIVEHSHNYTWAELRKRFYNEGRADAQIFGGKVSLLTACRQFAAEYLRDVCTLAPHPAEWKELLLDAPRRRFIQKFAARKGHNQFK